MKCDNCVPGYIFDKNTHICVKTPDYYPNLNNNKMTDHLLTDYRNVAAILNCFYLKLRFEKPLKNESKSQII